MAHLRKILFLGIIAVFIYAWPCFFSKNHYVFEEIISKQVSAAEKSPQVEQQSSKDYSAFLKDVERRRIFSPPKIEKPSKPRVDRNKLSRIIKDLRLAGIISGDNKRAVIEDKKQNNTYYLRQNEEFMNNIKVIKIGNNSVVLEIQGEKFELFL